MARHEIRHGAIGWVLDNMYDSDNRRNACLDEFLPYISSPTIVHRGRSRIDEFCSKFDEMDGDLYEKEKFL